MTCRPIATDKAPKAIGPYSQAILSGSWLFVSGQIPIDPKTGDLEKGTFADQVRRALSNLEAVVLAAGLGLEDVVSVDVFLADMERFAEFNAIYQDFFGSHRPARAVVAAASLPKGAAVEIKCAARSHGDA